MTKKKKTRTITFNLTASEKGRYTGVTIDVTFTGKICCTQVRKYGLNANAVINRYLRLKATDSPILGIKDGVFTIHGQNDQGIDLLQTAANLDEVEMFIMGYTKM